MYTFLQYLCEANSRGSTFESVVAKNVLNWIKAAHLESKFKAERYLTILEDNGHRQEDYSDIIVKDLKSGSDFFIECKKNTRDNILTTQFNIVDGCHLVPVKTISREASKSQLLKKLAEDIEATEDWKKFSMFMLTDSHGIKPIDVWLEKTEISDSLLFAAIDEYNKIVDSGNVESDSKKFDKDNIRLTTKNFLFVALQWRIAGNLTWDICHLRDIKYFGKLIRNHYMYGKAGEVKYIQLADNCFKFDDDPLETTCKDFPDVIGQFDLKFTPRFGVGGLYLTPRSKIIGKLYSNFTFKKA